MTAQLLPGRWKGLRLWPWCFPSMSGPTSTTRTELVKGSAVLKNINLKGNGIDTEGWCAIFHALRDNKASSIEEWNL